MSTLSKPSVQITLRYVVTYVLFVALALVGLFVFVRLRANVLDLSTFIGIDARFMHNMDTWGTYLLFVPYLAFLVWLEAFMHRGAKMNKIWQRAGIVFAVEIAAALLTALITFLLVSVPHP